MLSLTVVFTLFSLEIFTKPGGGGGGREVLQISSDGDDRMEAKVKPKYIPRDSNRTQTKPWTKN